MLVFPTMTKIEMLYFVSLIPFLQCCYAKPFNQMDGEIDEYRFAPYDAPHQFRDEQYENPRHLPVPEDLAPPPGLAWNFNVENVPVEPDSIYDQLPSLQRRHLKNLMRRFVDRETAANFGLQDRFYQKGGPGRSGNWSPFQMQVPVALKTKKPPPKAAKTNPLSFCDDKMSKLNRIFIKEHQIQLQFQKSKGENIDLSFNSPVIVEQEQVSLGDQQNSEPKSIAQQAINADDSNPETPKVEQQVKPEEEQFKPENKPESEYPENWQQGKQNKPETIPENKPDKIPEIRPEMISENRPEIISQNKQKFAPQNKPETISQNRPQILVQNKPENIPETAPQIKPETISEFEPPQNRPKIISQNKPETTLQNRTQTFAQNIPDTVPQNIPDTMSQSQLKVISEGKPETVQQIKPETAQQIKPEAKAQQFKQPPQTRPQFIPQTKNVEEEPETVVQQQKPSQEMKPYRIPPSEVVPPPKTGAAKSEESPQFFHLVRNKDANVEQQLPKTQNRNFEETDRLNPRIEEEKLPETVKNVVNRHSHASYGKDNNNYD